MAAVLNGAGAVRSWSWPGTTRSSGHGGGPSGAGAVRSLSWLVAGGHGPGTGGSNLAGGGHGRCGEVGAKREWGIFLFSFLFIFRFLVDLINPPQQTMPHER
jgi:hypothetical protein